MLHPFFGPMLGTNTERTQRYFSFASRIAAASASAMTLPNTTGRALIIRP
jgi:hypothetical protein